METKDKIKYPGFLNKLWHDPIWSKVIYAGIIFIISIIYSFISTLLKEISLLDAFIETINFELKLYAVFIIVCVVLVIYGFLYKYKQTKKRQIGRFDTEQKVGNFTFRELHNALLTHKIKKPINLQEAGVDKKIDLLTLFILYQRQLNRGVEWNHDHFSYYILGPTLMTYGLTEKNPTTNKLDKLGSDMIQTSKIGFEFYALIEKWRVYNDELVNEDITKIEDIEPKNEE